MKSETIARAPARLFALALAAGLLTTVAPAVRAQSPPVHTVKGGATFFLEAGVPDGGNLVLHYSINATLHADGTFSLRAMIFPMCTSVNTFSTMPAAPATRSLPPCSLM